MLSSRLYLLISGILCAVNLSGHTSTKSEDKLYSQLTNLPSVYIDTEDSTEINSKDHYINCTITWVDAQLTHKYTQARIRGRGNSTWRMSPKKPYRIKLATPVALLGNNHATNRDWTLLANHGDKTMLRNALTYDLGKFMHLPFCPAATFVDLFINHHYQGTYQISDQVEVADKRVDINKKKGILLETTSRWGLERNHFITKRHYPYNIIHPGNKHLTAQDTTRIKMLMQHTEDVIFGSNYKHPRKGWRSVIDEHSFINWYVASEITGNLDALLVIYLYRERQQKRWSFGPLWDMDFAYDRSGEQSMLYQLKGDLNFEDRPWQAILQRLWNDAYFARQCNKRLNEVLDKGLEQHLINSIDSISQLLQQSQAQNFKIWPIDQPVYKWEKPVYHTQYMDYITDLKYFIHEHLTFLRHAFARKISNAQP